MQVFWKKWFGIFPDNNDRVIFDVAVKQARKAKRLYAILDMFRDMYVQ